MVTAIVIPIICLYFYWLAKKDMEKSLQKWQELKNVPEEAVIYGEIMQVSGYKQRFSYYRFVYVLELSIQMDQRNWQVKKIIPIEKGFHPPEITKGENVVVYGNWKEEVFHISRIEKRA